MASFTLPVLDLWDWFLDETQTLLRYLPLRRDSNRCVCIELGTSGKLFPAEVQSKGTDDSILVESTDELERALDRLTGIQGRLCAIRIADGRFVARSLAPLWLPRSRTTAMARADVAANTPFEIEDVHILLPARSEPFRRSAYCLVKKAELDPIISAVCRRGRSIGALEFGAPDRNFQIDRVGLKSLNPKRLINRIRLGLATVLVITMISGLGCLFTLADARLETAERTLDQEIALARVRAGEARAAFETNRRRINQISSLKNEKSLTASTVYAWEQLSRALPDDTWLSDLTLEEGAIALTGLSASAAKLIPLLEDDEAFESPEFQSAVMKVPGQEVERFSLQMRLKKKEPDA